MGGIEQIRPGEKILASYLNKLGDRARLIDGLYGAPGASPGTPGTPRAQTRVYVTARAVSGPRPLGEHQYTVTDGTQEWDIDWTRLIVMVQPDLVLTGTNPQGFVPAEIAGQGFAGAQPWRAWGTLYRGPGADGAPDYAVELFGLAPHRGC